MNGQLLNVCASALRVDSQRLVIHEGESLHWHVDTTLVGKDLYQRSVHEYAKAYLTVDRRQGCGAPLGYFLMICIITLSCAEMVLFDPNAITDDLSWRRHSTDLSSTGDSQGEAAI